MITPVKMERALEIGNEAVGLLRTTFSPVNLNGELAEPHRPHNNVISESRTQNRSIGEELTIFSWNIFEGLNKELEQSLADLVTEHAPDVVFLQEAPVYSTGPLWRQGRLEETFNQFNSYYAPFHQLHQPTAHYNFNHSGLAILSQISFIKTEVYELPTVTRTVLGDNHITKRLLLYTQLVTDSGKKIGLYNIHLENGCWAQGRADQMKEILKIVDGNNDDISVLAGDFNTFLGKFEGALGTLDSSNFERVLPYEEFSLSPFLRAARLDHLYVRGTQGIVGYNIKAKGSDHNPFKGVIQLR